MYNYYISKNKVIYKIYEKANHVYVFNEDKTKVIKYEHEKFKATDINFENFKIKESLVLISELDYLNFIK